METNTVKKVIIGLEARKKLKAGVDLCADVVKVSMGGNGKNVAIYNGVTTEIFNDGVSIAKEVNQKDETLQSGIMLARQCAEQTNKDAGDGTTTTIVLLQALLKEIITDLSIESPRVVRENLHKEAESILSRIEPKEVKTKEEIYNIALTSSLDEKVAGILSSIFDTLGKNAKVTTEETDKDCVESEIVEGMQFEAKSLSNNILQNLSDEKIELNNVDVLYLEKADTIEKIQDKISSMSEERRTLVVISNQFTQPVLLALMNPSFKFYPVQNNEINNKEDIPVFIGSDLVKKVIIEKDRITLIGGKGNKSEHLEALKKKLESAESEYEKELIEKRIASLESGIAIVKVGKATDAERGESVLKIEDAINAVKGAMESGYVKGGGLALKEAGVGGILEKVCASPYEQIVKNGGDKEVKETVIDSFKSVKFSLLNALSTACSILTVEALLVEEKEDEQD